MEQFGESREVFSDPEIPVEPIKQKEREDQAYLRRKNTAEQKLAQELNVTQNEIDEAGRDFLRFVDFKKIRKIFAGIYQRCGMDEKNMNFIGEERLVFAAEGFGRYDAEGNYIQIFPSNIRTEKPVWQIKSAEKRFHNVNISMLATLIHEEAHAIGKNICIGIDDSSESSAYRQMGYVRSADPTTHKWDNKEALLFQGKPIETPDRFNRRGRIFNTLNEGVVEKLARLVTKEYLQDTDWNKPYILRKLDSKGEENIYFEEVELVDIMVAKIAKSTGLSEKTVFESFVRGLVEGETFISKEVEELFAETFGPTFLEELAYIDSGSAAEYILKLRELVNKHSK